MPENGWVDYMAKAEDALARLELADPYTTPDRLVAIAQVNATRALVEQQRIANLIALETLRWQRTVEHGHYWGPDVLWGPPRRNPEGDSILRADIAAALGVEVNGDD